MQSKFDVSIPLMNSTHNEIPYITTADMEELDRLMMQHYHIELIQMMEMAGNNLGRLCINYLRNKNIKSPTIGIMAGTGGNGGGALVAARYLNNWGADVHIYIAKPIEEYQGVPAKHLGILRKLNIPFGLGRYMGNKDLDLIIDGLIGYSLDGNPYGPAAEMITWCNEQETPVISMDLPSGFDGTTGEAYAPCIRAEATLTLALPKIGFRKEGAAEFTGRLYLADIGVPPQLYKYANITQNIPHIFQEDSIVELPL